MPHTGYLVIADITGYTAYLNQSELEHARDSLNSLITLLIEYTRRPLLISRLEGDAVISYALDSSVKQGQTLVELIENTYIAFRKARDLMIVNTTCDCRACSNIPNLDLKFFIHHGTFSFQHLGDFQELLGNDVNLIHRLTKNSVTEKTGLRAYALYTDTAINALGVETLTNEMTPHHETYEHIGEVQVFIQDMNTIWERDREAGRVVPKRVQESFTAFGQLVENEISAGRVVSEAAGLVSNEAMFCSRRRFDSNARNSNI